MRRLSTWQRFVPVALLLAATAVILQARTAKEILPTHEDLSTFPMQIRDWHGRELEIAPDSLEVLGPGQFLLRDYLRSSLEPPVNLFIAFFPSQRTGDTIHSPKNCLPGAGWAPLESGRISVQRDDGSKISVDRYLIAKGTDRGLVLYWYQAHGRVTPSEYWAKIFLVTDSIRLNRTDGALVRVVTPIIPSEGQAAAEVRAVGFAKELLQLLDAYIPR
jgi:EpsI family protein